jgi:hypothetical protein
MATTPKTTVTVLPAKRTVVLTKEQFGNSNLPGSEFVRAQSKVFESPYSLARLAAMGLIGAGTGAGIGKYSKRSLAKGALIGGVAGAASSLLYDLLSKEDEPDVVGAAVTPDGRASIMIVGSKRGIARKKSGQSAALKATPLLIAKGHNISKYPGWAGVIMQHGLLVQRCMMNYIYDHAQYHEPMQIEPHWGYTLKGWGAKAFTVTGSGAFADEDKDYSNGTLWTNRYVEWPSPIFGGYGIGTPAPGTLLSSIAKVLNYAKSSDGKTWTHVSWENHIRSAWTKYGIFGGLKYLPNMMMFKPDPWWNQGSRMDQFTLRYGKTMQRAQWFVWAAEMLRIHADCHLSKGDLGHWWADHCMQWGVGCASDIRLSQKKTMVNFPSDYWMKDTHGKKMQPNMNPCIVPLSDAAVIEYLKLVVAVSPPPFTSSPSKQINIYPEGTERTFLDFPEEFLGSIVPPMNLINKDWYNSLVGHFQEQGAPKSLRIFIYAVQAVIELVATYYGGPAGTLIGAFVACAMTLCRLGMSNGGKLSMQDISKLIGTIVSAIADVADLSEVSGTFTSMLSSMEEVLDDAGLKGVLNGCMDAMESLSKNVDWPYVNDLLSTTNDIERSLGANVDQAISNL